MSPEPAFLTLVSSAAGALNERKEDVNRLNVFPVPDGDTGTNMALTMDAVLEELRSLPADANAGAVCRAITHGSLMGARGNSGVILSQILRGVCEVVGAADRLNPQTIASALDRARVVAFQAVRKPVEGTMLTVLKDMATAASSGVKSGLDLDAMLDHVMKASFDSVRRTPELLPVLKENNVVDAGGYGLAILAEGIVAAYAGHTVSVPDFASEPIAVAIEQENDWDDDQYLYCTEFLLFSESATSERLGEFVASVGGSELVVGGDGSFKIHVHTDDPGAVLAHMTTLGEVAEVHVNNMRKQTEARSQTLRAEGTGASTGTPPAPFGIVSVATGDGLAEILRSLGTNVVVSGGQTMNPSTAELLAAADTLNAESILILPNNRNIILAAQQAAELATRPTGVVPTKTVPEAFAALLSYDPDATLEDNVADMTEAAAAVTTGEVTTAVKDSKAKAGEVKEGQVIGIVDHEIEVIGDDVVDVTLLLIDKIAENAETLTILAGEDLDDAGLSKLVERIEKTHPDAEVEAHRGDQPLYPVILAAE